MNAKDSDPPDALTLFDAVAWAFGESSGIRVPAIRVPLVGITAWWVGQGEVVKSSEPGTGMFGFVSFPLNVGQ